MDTSTKRILAIFGALILIALVLDAANIVPGIIRWGNEVKYETIKADDETSYRKRQQVENTCRAEIASYNAYVLQAEQYKGDTSEYGIQQRRNAVTMANSVATKYNLYILQNSFVWRDNVPDDIYRELAPIE